eukprot:139363_1
MFSSSFFYSTEFLVGLLTIICCNYWLSYTILYYSICCIIVFFWITGRKLITHSSSPNLFNNASKVTHDQRRFKTYGPPVPNTWYHIIDSDEVKANNNKVIYVRAIGQNFAIWRTKNGEPIVMDAYCPHLGANLGVGGTVTDDDCIKCPFHGWKFDKNGILVDVPYIADKSKLEKIRCRPIDKWIAKDFCGLLCVYFHADFEEDCVDNNTYKPQFDLPECIINEINSKKHGWHLHSKNDIGHVELSVIDWVDQSGDHGHFQTLHSQFNIPYTNTPLPDALNKLIGIEHEPMTIIGNKWIEKLHGKKDPYYGNCDCKYYIYFLDKAAITWKRKAIPETKSLTKEFYIGPAIMIFHIPLQAMGLGSIKVFVTTTPTLNSDGYSGGSVMRIRIWLSDYSLKLRIVSWFIVGIATSQLLSDIKIMCNKIRNKTPCITKGCGPYNIVNTWLKNFYSKSSSEVGKSNLDW